MVRILQSLSDIFTTHHILKGSTKINVRGSAFLLGFGLLIIPLSQIFVGGKEPIAAIVYNLASYLTMIFAGVVSLRLHPFNKVLSDYSKLNKYLFTGYLIVLFVYSLINMFYLWITKDYLVNTLSEQYGILPNMFHAVLIFLCSILFVWLFLIRAKAHNKSVVEGRAMVIWCLYYVAVISLCGYITLTGFDLFWISSAGQLQ